LTQIDSVPEQRDSSIIINNSAIQIFRRVVLIGFSSVIVLFLPKYLGDVGLGQLTFAQSIAGLFATVLSLGLGRYITKETARDHSFLTGNLSVAMGLRVLMSFAVVAIVFGIVQVMGDSWDAPSLMYVAAATAISLSFARLMASVLYGLENLSHPAMIEVASRLLVLVIGIPVLVMGMGVVAYASVLLLAAVVNFGATAVLVWRKFRFGVRFDPPVVKSLIIGGAPFILMGLVLDLYGQVDTIILRIFTEDAVVGWYAAANNIYKTIDLVPLAITAALLPTLSRVHFSNSGASAAISRKIIVLIALAIVPAGLGISLFSTHIISFLPYPDSFQNSIPLLTILALTIPITAVLLVIGTVAVAVDRQKPWAFALLATTLLNIIMNIVAVTYFHDRYGNGAVGVALTTLLSEIVMVVLGVFILPRTIMSKALGIGIAKIGFAGMGMVAVVLLMRQSFGFGMFIEIPAGCLTYVAFSWLLKTVSKEDAAFVRNLFDSKIRSRFSKRRY
jgi:PST family polysaccharide transporter